MQKPKQNFLIICDKAELDKDNKLNIIGVFDSINADGFPAVHSELAIIANFNLDKGKHREYFIIEDDSGNELISNRSDQVEIDTTKDRHQFIHKIQNLLLPREGKYNVKIFIDGNEVGNNYFYAKLKVN